MTSVTRTAQALSTTTAGCLPCEMEEIRERQMAKILAKRSAFGIEPDATFVEAGKGTYKTRPTDDGTTAAWEGILGVEGELTGDGRLIQPEALRWDALPIPLRHVGADVGAHQGAEVSGRILTVERLDVDEANERLAALGQEPRLVEGVRVIWGTGDFDLESDVGVEAARKVDRDLMTGVSMDLDDVAFEVRVAAEAAKLVVDGMQPLNLENPDADGRIAVKEVSPDDEVMVTMSARVRAATQVAVPAFAGAKLHLTAQGKEALAAVLAKREKARTASAGSVTHTTNTNTTAVSGKTTVTLTMRPLDPEQPNQNDPTSIPPEARCAHEGCDTLPTFSVSSSEPGIDVLYCAEHAAEHEDGPLPDGAMDLLSDAAVAAELALANVALPGYVATIASSLQVRGYDHPAAVERAMDYVARWAAGGPTQAGGTDAVGPVTARKAGDALVEWTLLGTGHTDFNWVEDAGGLPKYIKRISDAIQKKGTAEGHAIAIAVNAVKKMCATGDVNFPGKQEVNAGSRAEACAAVAEWEAKRAKAKADSATAMPFALREGWSLVAAGTQAFAYNKDQWRNPKDGKWIDMPQVSLGKLLGDLDAASDDPESGFSWPDDDTRDQLEGMVDMLKNSDDQGKLDRMPDAQTVLDDLEGSMPSGGGDLNDSFDRARMSLDAFEQGFIPSEESDITGKQDTDIGAEDDMPAAEGSGDALRDAVTEAYKKAYPEGNPPKGFTQDAAAVKRAEQEYLNSLELPEGYSVETRGSGSQESTWINTPMQGVRISFSPNREGGGFRASGPGLNEGPFESVDEAISSLGQYEMVGTPPNYHYERGDADKDGDAGTSEAPAAEAGEGPMGDTTEAYDLPEKASEIAAIPDKIREAGANAGGKRATQANRVAKAYEGMLAGLNGDPENDKAIYADIALDMQSRGYVGNEVDEQLWKDTATAGGLTDEASVRAALEEKYPELANSPQQSTKDYFDSMVAGTVDKLGVAGGGDSDNDGDSGAVETGAPEAAEEGDGVARAADRRVDYPAEGNIADLSDDQLRQMMKDYPPGDGGGFHEAAKAELEARGGYVPEAASGDQGEAGSLSPEDMHDLTGLQGGDWNNREALQKAIDDLQASDDPRAPAALENVQAALDELPPESDLSDADLDAELLKRGVPQSELDLWDRADKEDELVNPRYAPQGSAVGGPGNEGVDNPPELSDDVLMELDRLDGMEMTDPEVVDGIRSSLAQGDLQSASNTARAAGYDDLADAIDANGSGGGQGAGAALSDADKAEAGDFIDQVMGSDQADAFDRAVTSDPFKAAGILEDAMNEISDENAGSVDEATLLHIIEVLRNEGDYSLDGEAMVSDDDEQPKAGGKPTVKGRRLRIPPAKARTAAAPPHDPDAPPAAHFANPCFKTRTPLTITRDGRVMGHLATWGSCHLTHTAQGKCVTPPRTRSNYAFFNSGHVLTAEGTEVAVGQLTLDTGHADQSFSMRRALAHYDNTGMAVADVTVGEDSFGIWFSGSLRPGLTPLQVRKLRASPLSGDWRDDGRGNLELVAALAVNVQGYPVPRPSGQVRHGQMVSLVAAGLVPPSKVTRPGTPGALSREDLMYLKRLANRERAAEMAAHEETMTKAAALARQIQAREMASRVASSVSAMSGGTVSSGGES